MISYKNAITALVAEGTLSPNEARAVLQKENGIMKTIFNMIKTAVVFWAAIIAFGFTAGLIYGVIDKTFYFAKNLI